MDGPSPRFALPLVLLAAGLLFFSQLRAPLLEPQEARYAEIPRQMLAEGSLLVPRLHGQDYLDKPPLFYWAILSSYHLFGVRDSSARLVPGFAGVLTVLVVYLWGRRFLGNRGGLCAALILTLMPQFVYRARLLTFDTLLGLEVIAALALAYAALASGAFSWKAWLLSALCAGLGLLTKGPVALVLVVPPLALLPWLDRSTARPSLLAWVAYLAGASAVAAPWFLAVTGHDSGFGHEFFWRHNVVRFLAPFDHAKPAWYYLPLLGLGVLPWWLLLPDLIRRLRESPGVVGFSLVAFGWILLFFTASGCKRPTYLLPAFPLVALPLGWAASLAWDRACWRPATTTAILFLSGVGISLAAVVVQMVPMKTGILLASVAGVGLGGVLILGRRIVWAQTFAAGFLVLYAGVQWLLPGYHTVFSLRGSLRRLTGAEERGGRAIVCHPQRYDSASFYLPGGEVAVFGIEQRRELIAHLQRHPGTVLLVKSGRVCEQLLAELPAGMEFRLHRRGAITTGRVVSSRRVPPALAEGVASAKPPGSLADPAQGTVLLDGLDHVLAATGAKPTQGRQQRAKDDLIQPDEGDQ